MADGLSGLGGFTGGKPGSGGLGTGNAGLGGVGYGAPTSSMTAGAAAMYNQVDMYSANNVSTRDAPFVNPPVVSALNQIPPDLSGQPLQRGYLIEDPSDQTIDPDKRYRLNFHFNPELVNEGWDVDFESDPLADQSAPLQGNIRPKGVSFSWTMIFDRLRFEQRVPEGVMADSRIMSKILTRGVGGPDSAQNALYPAPVKVVFGPGGVGTNFAQSWFAYQGKALKNQWIKSPLGATGLIMSYSCTYTRFNKLMIPTRAVMDITIRVNYWLPSASTNPTNETYAQAATRGAAGPGLPPNKAWDGVRKMGHPGLS